jgi:hypothetical protein
MAPRGLWKLLICLALAAPAAGDAVMMKDGTVHRGEVTQQGGKVMIKQGLGVIAVDAKDVDKIIKSAAPAAEVAPAPTPTSAPTVSLDTARPTGPEAYTRPESHVFLEMREMASLGAGAASFDAGQKVKTWQTKVHDSERRVGQRWMSPKDCERQRDEYKEKLAKTNVLMTKIRQAGSTTSAGKAEQAKLRRSLSEEFRQAARVWPDTLMSDLLEALAYLEGQNNAMALQGFRLCSTTAPRVAAFRQGMAIALGLREQRMEALTAAMDVLQLQPDSRDAFDLASDTLMSTPGKLMLEPGYVLAKSIIDQYDAPPKTANVRTGINWMMPGRAWMSRENMLPTPPYDRLAFRQAVGIPVGPNALLVDHSALKDALEVFIALDSKTLVPAHVVPGGASGTVKGKAPPPVDLIAVEDLTFTPLEVEAGAAGGGKGVQVTGATVGVFEEMGSELRPLSGTLEAGVGEGEAKLTVRLSPGEVTAPVISKDGHLVGFLEGRTDAMADGGGPEKFVPVAAADNLIKRASRPLGFSGGYARVKRKAVAKPAPGQFFLVYITAADGLPAKK